MIKLKINNETLSKEDKLKKYKLLKPKCINCKRSRYHFYN